MARLGRYIEHILAAALLIFCASSAFAPEAEKGSVLLPPTNGLFNSCIFGLKNSTLELKGMVTMAGKEGVVLQGDAESKSILRNVAIFVDWRKEGALFSSEGCVRASNMSIAPALETASLHCSVCRMGELGTFALSESSAESVAVSTSSFILSGAAKSLSVCRCTFFNFSVKNEGSDGKEEHCCFCQETSMSGCQLERVDDPVDGSVVPHFGAPCTGLFVADNNTFLNCQRGMLKRRLNKQFTDETFTKRQVAPDGETEVIFVNCKWERCTSGSNVYGGGLFCESNTVALQLKECCFNECQSDKSGGAVAVLKVKSILVLSSDFFNCSCNQYGGGIRVARITNCLKFSECNFEECSSNFVGGGIYLDNEGSECDPAKYPAYSSLLASTNSLMTNVVNDKCQYQIFHCSFSKCTATNFGGGVFIIRQSRILTTEMMFLHCNTLQKQGGGLDFESQKKAEAITHEMKYALFDYCSAGSGIGHDVKILDTYRLVDEMFFECRSRSNTPDGNRVCYTFNSVDEVKNEWIPLCSSDIAFRITASGSDEIGCEKSPIGCQSIKYILDQKASENTISINVIGSSLIVGKESNTGIIVDAKTILISGKLDTLIGTTYVIPGMALDVYFFNVLTGKLELSLFDVSVPSATCSMVLVSGSGELVVESQNIKGVAGIKYTNPLIQATNGKVSMEMVRISEMLSVNTHTPLMKLSNTKISMMLCDIETGGGGVFTDEYEGKEEEFACRYATGSIAVTRGAVTIEKCKIKSNSWGGLSVDNADVIIIDSDITENALTYKSMKGERNLVCHGGGIIRLKASKQEYLDKVQYWINDGCALTDNLTQIDSTFIRPVIVEAKVKETSTEAKLDLTISGRNLLSCGVKVQGKRGSDADDVYQFPSVMSFNGMESIEATFNLPAGDLKSVSSSGSSEPDGSKAKNVSNAKKEFFIRLQYLKEPNLSGASVWDSAKVAFTSIVIVLIDVDDPIPQPDPTPSEPRRTNEGAIIGAVLGSVLGVFVIVAAVVSACCCYHRKVCCYGAKKEKYEEEDANKGEIEESGKEVEMNAIGEN
ncbi:uncharacterized protein MONOS_9051 [Monocercomonoides exilis]|uniref:uncharacterized protein n=1 Tax=Monocercomonoides exilis TaxID=2049356 RepID=UPI003559539E|nr:hypothetical protein MONOS_9051 [Monocercomonoides exilis]|eukprot:MONOS_9051.1-p1 / transcript=MONOS_9051.1 / gene=MONOS_9051 / organism=Monocercomonoides_exilis_PA203 / gene_product=unspecified product / transcript_product=unspecified product / location=Mono_scaffold00360:39326-42490(+) / protein_length=1055 / sequence_SO=supercontig / SO=protein_coding / is_pseudo=false